MHPKVLFAFLFLVTFQWLGAQQFVSPKKVTTGITVAIEINDEKDLDYVRDNISKFYGVQRVRINGDVNISRAAAIIELLDDVQDLQMVKFTGDLSDEVILKLEWVENLTFYLKNGREDAVLMNNHLGRLNGLTLVFEVVPDDYFFLDDLGTLRSLTLIAPFTKKDAAIAMAQVLKLQRLRHLGISLDRVDDLPPTVAALAGLESLTIIDNLSWILEKYTVNLPVLRRNIEFTAGKRIRHILFEYKAQDAELYPWDVNHLYSIWPDTRFAPIPSANGDTTEMAAFAGMLPLKKDKAPVWSKTMSENIISSPTDGEYYFAGKTQTDAIFYMGSEAALLVPKECFKTASDSVYKGVYGIKCLWLNQAGEQFIRGINANYDSSGRSYELASAAQLQLSVANDKTQLQLRDGYFIKVVFRSRPDSADRFYAWNEKRNKWEHYYDYDYNFDDSKLAATDFYSFYGNQKTATEWYAMDRSALQRRFEYDGYWYMLNPDEQRISLESHNGFYIAPVYNRAPKNGAYTLKRGKGLIGLKKEYVDRKTEQDIVKFRLYDKTETLFPELKPFENYVFEISTSLSPRDFSNMYIRGVVYSDVRIQPSGTGYEVALKTDAGIVTLKLLSAGEKYRGHPGKAKSAHNEFMRHYNKYRSILVQKEAALQNWMETYQNSATAEARNQLFFPLKMRQANSYEFRIRSTGTFIWGHPVMQPDTFNLILVFTDDGGIPFDVKKVWIAHNNPFEYRSFGAQPQYNCNINPNELAYIACMDQKGKIYLMPGADFRLRRIQNNSLVYLPVAEFPHSLKNMRELEKKLYSIRLMPK